MRWKRKGKKREIEDVRGGEAKEMEKKEKVNKKRKEKGAKIGKLRISEEIVMKWKIKKEKIQQKGKKITKK